MSVVTFPDGMNVSRFKWGQLRRDIAHSSVFGSQSVEVSAPLWAVQLMADKGMAISAQANAWKALMMSLAGQTNQLALWDIGNPAPQGTMRGTMTLNGAHAQGATALSIVASGQNTKTLLAGDLIGIGSGTSQQVVMVTADATSNGSGVIAVNVLPALRNAFSTGAAVTWDKPKALFRRVSGESNWEYDTTFISGFSLDLVEDWRP